MEVLGEIVSEIESVHGHPIATPYKVQLYVMGGDQRFCGWRAKASEQGVRRSNLLETGQHPLKQFKGFPRLASYYLRFVCSFSCIADTWFKLLWKDQASDVTWTLESQQASSNLKTPLVEVPELWPQHPLLPFVLDTDVRTGLCLPRWGPKGERAITYYSRTFNKEEWHYCIACHVLCWLALQIRPVCPAFHYKDWSLHPPEGLQIFANFYAQLSIHKTHTTSLHPHSDGPYAHQSRQQFPQRKRRSPRHFRDFVCASEVRDFVEEEVSLMTIRVRIKIVPLYIERCSIYS